MLDSVRSAFANAANDVAGVSRLVTVSRISFTLSLPKSLLERIEAIPGVAEVTYANWFGGIYQDPKNFFANEAVAANFLQLYPEWQMPEAERAAFRATRTGAVAGERLAQRFHWRLGDKIPLQATIFPQKNGENTWTLDLEGIFHERDPKQRGQEEVLYFNWDYFDEARAFGNGNVGWYITRVADPAATGGIARAIDALSENSDHETKTQTERAFQASFVSQFGDVGLIVGAIMGAVFFTLLLLTGNTMAQAVRERIPELAVLKTLGFSHRAVLLLVLAESVLLIALGGILGMALAAAAVSALSTQLGGQIPLAPLDGATWLRGLALTLGIGILVGAGPARRAMRLRIVDALAGR